jgi:hypothetical protein
LLEGMLTTPQREHLSAVNGKYSAAAITPQMRADMAGGPRSNDMCERVFGCYDMQQTRFRGIAQTSASAQAQESINHHVGSRPMLATRGKGNASGRPEPSLLATIPEHEAMSLIETARTNVGRIKVEDTADLVRQMTCSLKDFQAKQARQLRITAAKFADAMKYYVPASGAGNNRRITTKPKLEAALKSLAPNKKIEVLKEQINIRVKGYGWDQFKAPWSSSADKTVGTYGDLYPKTLAMFAEEKVQKLKPPPEPPVPDAATKKIKALGTLTAQAQVLKEKKSASAAELRTFVAAAAAAKEKEALDKQDENAHGQPSDAPAPSAKMLIEVFALVEEETDDGTTTDYKQWLAAQIIASADGSADFKKGKGKAKRKVPVGWHLVQYTEDGAEEWLRLGESNFNTQAKGAWRLDLDFAEAGSEEDRASGSEEEDEDEEAGASGSSSDSDSE